MGQVVTTLPRHPEGLVSHASNCAGVIAVLERATALNTHKKRLVQNHHPVKNLPGDETQLIVRIGFVGFGQQLKLRAIQFNNTIGVFTDDEGWVDANSCGRRGWRHLCRTDGSNDCRGTRRQLNRLPRQESNTTPGSPAGGGSVL